MINTLIVEDNMQYCKHIINYIIAESKNLQISYLATEGDEALEFLSKNEVDLIILDLKLPKISGIDIVERLQKTEQYGSPKVFLLSGDSELLYKACLNPIVVSYSNKIEPIKITYNKIQKIADEIENNLNVKDIKTNFQNELTTLGFNFKYKGTKYLLDSIMYIYLNNQIDLMDNLEKYVYKAIALQNKKSVCNIKTNITKACNLAYLYQNKNIIKEYFSVDLKPTPKIIISTILSRYMKE